MKRQYALYIEHDELPKLIRNLTASVQRAPDGYLHIVRKGRAVQYYHRLDGSRTGTYIRKEELDLSKQLAQKAYEQECLNAAQYIDRELRKSGRKPKTVSLAGLNDVYNNLRPERKRLVKPVVVSDEEFLKRWIANQKPGSSYEKPDAYITLNGEKVRSKSEMMIADRLKLLGLPYKYEQPLFLADGRVVFPDFTILDTRSRQDVYYEHFGRMGEEKYLEDNVAKYNRYLKSGYSYGSRFLCSFETNHRPIDMEAVENMLRQRFDLMLENDGV